MNDPVISGINWIGHGWMLVLAFTLATLCVALLRRPCRRLFGAERAFQLWLLPLLAMLASQLPHAASASVTTLPRMVFMITSVASNQAAPVGPAAAIDWHGAIILVWLAGCASTLARAFMAQRRYRARLDAAVPVSGLPLRWPVLRAVHVDVGPALVGAWRARIVLPADFDQRYDRAEQRLVIAHETMHACRRDGWWCLLAQFLAAVLWFHPLAWWGSNALRHDLELACDAAVLREHAVRRRIYANAMLKTQSLVLAPPIGCGWSPRHPITERIAMLKLPLPARRRRHVGTIVGLGLASALASAVYAASAPSAPPAKSVVAAGPVYQLDMKIDLATDDGHRRHAENAALALCMVPGKPGMASVGRLNVDATIAGVNGGRMSVDLAVAHAGSAPQVRRRLLVALDKPFKTTGVDGTHVYTIDITPRAGCPAQIAAEASPVKVTEHVRNGSARAVAESVAEKAGWALVNPAALVTAPVTLSFNDMPAGTALQAVAELAGMNAVFEGRRVRFAPR